MHINDDDKVNLDAAFYSGSRARIYNFNMYAHNEASVGLPTETEPFVVIC